MKVVVFMVYKTNVHDIISLKGTVYRKCIYSIVKGRGRGRREKTW